MTISGPAAVTDRALTSRDHREHVLVARAPQALLRPEVVQDQRGAHAGVRGDGPQADAEALRAEPADRGVPDAGAGGRVVGRDGPGALLG